MEKKTRIILLSVLSILIVICIVLGVTYSFMQANIENNSVTEVNLSSCAKLTLNDTDISISLTNSYPMSKNKALETTPYTFSLTSSCDGGVGFNLYLATLNSNTLDSSNIHYIITNHGSKNILVEGILSDATDGLSDFTSEEQAQLNSGINGTFANIYKIYVNGIYTNETKEYDLYLYIDESVTAPNTMNQSFVAGVAAKSFDYNMVQVTNVIASDITNNSITLTVEATAGESQIATYYFSSNDGGYYEESTNNTYTFNNLEQGVEYNFKAYAVDTNGISSNVYSLNESTLSTVYLADYIKNTVYTGTDGENGLYYHDGVGSYTNASEEAGDNSYRYAGANPNNYVCFGSDESTCPNENLYRIIGVFGDQAKLIKSTSYGNYAWDSNNTNNWQTSTLKNTLNSTYLNSLGEWSNLIEANTTWYLGGASTNQATPKQFYGYERGTTVYSGRPTSDITAIGLMYPSDYGYAASPDYWAITLNSYNSATSANWLYLGSDEWTITPNSSYSDLVFYVSGSGYLSSSYANYGYAVRPVFYLKSNVALVDGVGTSSDPYHVAIA